MPEIRCVRRRRYSLAIVAGLALTVGAPKLHAQVSEEPKVELELLADATAARPGDEPTLAIRFRIEPGWHIYWRNSGQAGMPPQVEWHLPEGYRVGPLRFPAPQRRVDPGGVITYVLAGEPVLLAKLRIPANARPGTTAQLAADVRWLVCKEQCVLGHKRVELALPIVTRSASTQPAHMELFQAARAALPIRPDQAKFVRLKSASDVKQVRPGQAFRLILTLQIQRGYHIQSHKPTLPGLVPLQVFPDAVEGFQIGPPEFPEPERKTYEGLGQLSQFTGTVQIVMPVKAPKSLAGERVTLGGVLTFQVCDDAGRCYRPQSVSWQVTVPVVGGVAAPRPAAQSQEGGPWAWLEFTTKVFIGFLGGLILNLMPCVLPVISIKVVSFIQEAGAEPRRVRRLGLAFCAGILVWFWIFAVLTMLGKVSLLQYPSVVVGLCAVIFVLGLSLFGVFEITLPGRAASVLDAAGQQEGYLGSFLKGLFVTLLGTACSAPLLGVAFAWAITQPWTSILTVFTAAGLGMSLPYLLLSAKPVWMKFLPKPGEWMVTFKQLMGFLLMATTIWLLWVVGKQLGESGLIWTVTFLGFLSLSAWIVGKIGPGWGRAAKLSAWAASLAVLGAGGWFCYGIMYEPAEPAKPGIFSQAMGMSASSQPTSRPTAEDLDWSDGIPWQPYQPGLAEALAAQGYTVYVDYTAAWCVTCLTNKATVLETEPVRRRMRQLGVVPLQADLTRPDAVLADELRRFGRTSVPLNVIYPAGRPDEPIVLCCDRASCSAVWRRQAPRGAPPRQATPRRPAAESDRMARSSRAGNRIRSTVRSIRPRVLPTASEKARLVADMVGRECYHCPDSARRVCDGADAMSTPNREQVIDALRSVEDPELGRDLVSLGMIKQVEVQDGRVAVEVELTTPSCPLKGRIGADVEAAVRRLEGVRQVDVRFSARVRSDRPSRTELPGVKNIIAVGAGKGGVGKSTVAVLLAVGLQRDGARVGLLDADVYGPSIPMMLGIEGRQPGVAGQTILPVDVDGLKVMSIGLIAQPDDAIIWRGPMVHSAVRQFLEQVAWDELDYLIVDLPPGTGDVPLSLTQLLAVTGAVVVCTPQPVALRDARRAVKMYERLKTPCLGIIENMSFYVCPNCGHRDEIFAHGGAETAARELGVPFLGAIPLNTQLRVIGDEGTPSKAFTELPEPLRQAVHSVVEQLASRVSIRSMLRTTQDEG